MNSALRLAALAAAAGIALAGCSNPNAGGGGETSGVKADGTAQVEAQELTVWTNSADPASIRNVYKRFGEKFGVKMNIIELPADGFENQVQTKWSAGDRPDILEYHATSNFWALNPEKNLIDLSGMPFVEKSGSIYESVGSQNGKTYAAMTTSPGLFGIFFNKPVFERNGLKAPESFADLKEICTVLKQKDPSVVPIFESGGSVWPTQILPISYMGSAQKNDKWAQQVLDKKTTYDAPASPFVAALKAYEDFHKSDCFNKNATTATFEQSIQAVAQGTAAMTAQGSDVSLWNEQFGGDTAKTDSTIGFAPVAADGPTASWGPNVSGTWFVPNTGDAKRANTALSFIQYATGEGYQQYVDESKTFPLIEGATDPSGVQSLQREVAKYFKHDSVMAFSTNLVGATPFPSYTTGILAGTESPDNAGAGMQKSFEQAAKAARLPGW